MQVLGLLQDGARQSCNQDIACYTGRENVNIGFLSDYNPKCVCLNFDCSLVIISEVFGCINNAYFPSS